MGICKTDDWLPSCVCCWVNVVSAAEEEEDEEDAAAKDKCRTERDAKNRLLVDDDDGVDGVIFCDCPAHIGCGTEESARNADATPRRLPTIPDSNSSNMTAGAEMLRLLE